MQARLAQKLRLLRVRQGLTLVEAAKKTGVTRVTLSELERGHREPVATTLVKIADGYGVPIEELLEEPVPTGKPEAPPAALPSGAEHESSEAGQGTVEEQREELRITEEMCLEAYSLLENLGETYRSAGDEKALEALGYVAFFSGYGALQHVEEEADVDSIEDEETLALAERARKAAVQVYSLAEILDAGGRDEVTAMRRKKAPTTTARGVRVRGA